MDFTEKEFIIRSPLVTAFRLENDVVVEVSSEKKLAKSGDWIVTYKDGKKKILSNEEFIKEHILIDDNLGDI